MTCLVEFVKAHWKDDWYFGYQCLNGCNPLLLRQTRLLPPNLSVTSEMLSPFLPEGSSLEQELLVCRIYFWATVMVGSSGFRVSHIRCLCVTEGGCLPAGLRGFRRHPRQCGQWKADVHLSPALSPPLKPAGTAAPHRHPGEQK